MKLRKKEAVWRRSRVDGEFHSREERFAAVGGKGLIYRDRGNLLSLVSEIVGMS